MCWSTLTDVELDFISCPQLGLEAVHVSKAEREFDRRLPPAVCFAPPRSLCSLGWLCRCG